MSYYFYLHLFNYQRWGYFQRTENPFIFVQWGQFCPVLARELTSQSWRALHGKREAARHSPGLWCWFLHICLSLTMHFLFSLAVWIWHCFKTRNDSVVQKGANVGCAVTLSEAGEGQRSIIVGASEIWRQDLGRKQYLYLSKVIYHAIISLLPFHIIIAICVRIKMFFLFLCFRHHSLWSSVDRIVRGHVHHRGPDTGLNWANLVKWLHYDSQLLVNGYIYIQLRKNGKGSQKQGLERVALCQDKAH